MKLKFLQRKNLTKQDLFLRLQKLIYELKNLSIKNDQIQLNYVLFNDYNSLCLNLKIFKKKRSDLIKQGLFYDYKSLCMKLKFLQRKNFTKQDLFLRLQIGRAHV